MGVGHIDDAILMLFWREGDALNLQVCGRGAFRYKIDCEVFFEVADDFNFRSGLIVLI